MEIQELIGRLHITTELLRKEINPAISLDIYFYKTVCDLEKIEKILINPLFSIREQERYIQSLCKKQKINSTEELYSQMITGNVLVVLSNDYYFFDAIKF